MSERTIENRERGEMAGEDSAARPGRPVLRIVRGEPDDLELAALAAVVAGLAAGERPEPAPEARSAWADKASMMRRPLAHGPGAWRASALPR